MNTPRLLLALQYWAGDKARAGELARLITDLEPTVQRRADILLSARFDATHDPEVIAYAGRRFNVYTTIGTTRLVGHPAGSFGLWRDTIQAIRTKCASGEMPRYTCCLVFEADCAPLSRKWIDELLDGWLAKHPRALAVGHEWHASKCPWPHINGNMLVSGSEEALDTLLAWRGNPAKPWDVEIYPYLRERGAVDSPLIRSLYTKKTPDGFMGRLRAVGAAFLHGDKDGTAQALVRKYTLKGKNFPDMAIRDHDGGPLFVDQEDEVPSVFEQVPGVRIKFPQGLPARRYNPGLLRDGDGWLLAYRRIALNDWRSELVLSRWSLGWDFLSERVITGLARWKDAWHDYYEDPRLVRSAEGNTLMAYTHTTYAPARTANQRFAVVDLGADDIVLRDYAPIFGFNEPVAGRQEKNWTPFYLGAELHFIYNISPFTVVRASDNATTTNTMVPGVVQWTSKYGEPRGGTPPVRAGSRWVSYFHSRTPHKAREWRYHWGAFEFEVSPTARGARARVTRFTEHPIATASERDGFLWPKGACFWEPVVVFPTGAHFEDGTWTVAAGVNDSAVGVFTFKSDFLDAAFSRRKPARYSL